MKKFLTFVLVCCLVFSCSSTVFATATQWDTSDQANLRYIATSVTSGGSLYTLVNNIYSRLGTISNNITDIKSYLFDSNHGIAYWVHAINTWMSPIYTAIQNTPTQLESIKRLLGYVSYEGETEVIDPYLAYQSKGVTQWVSEVKGFLSNKGLTGNAISVFNPTWDWSLTTLSFTPYEDQLKNLLYFDVQQFNSFNNAMAQLLKYTNHARYYTDWNTLDRVQMTNYSLGDSILNYLNMTQQPLARLSYVLASNERIEAQEKAADTEQAVVDNFIDSSGSGAASTSDFSNVSDLSSGFKNNISTDASISGIWNIFNTDNFGWFSQETADQLDTSGSSARTLRSSGSYPTPLLDQQTEDILKYIGGNNND